MHFENIVLYIFSLFVFINEIALNGRINEIKITFGIHSDHTKLFRNRGNGIVKLNLFKLTKKYERTK